MKCQSLFYEKNITNLSSADLAKGETNIECQQLEFCSALQGLTCQSWAKINEQI